VVVIEVVEGTLAKIDVSTDGRYRPERLRNRIERHAQGPVNVGQLERGLARLQEDERIASVAARLLPSEERGRSDLEVRVHEAPPYALGLELSNYEVPSIGAYRTRLDAAYLNVLGYGDTVSTTLSFTEGLQEIEASYEVPLNAAGTTVGVFTDQIWSDVVEDSLEDLDIESRSWTAGLSLRHPVFEGESHRVELFGTAERRYSKSLLLGSGFSFSEGPEDGESNVTVLRFGQEWSMRQKRQVFVARSVLSWGNGELGATTHSDTGVPDSRFLAWLAQLQWAQRFAWLDTLLIARVDGQLTNDALLGLEQFAIGGHATVRGYRENQVVRDQGLVTSLEVRVPLWKTVEGQPILQLAPFFDYGYSWNQDRPTPGPNQLPSVGVGLRWAVTRFAQAEIYWGHNLNGALGSGDLQDHGVSFAVRVSLP
jgi:hemolysin activation/secretion protein